MAGSLGYVAVIIDQATNRSTIMGSGDIVDRWQAEAQIESARHMNKIGGIRERYAIAEVYLEVSYPDNYDYDDEGNRIN